MTYRRDDVIAAIAFAAVILFSVVSACTQSVEATEVAPDVDLPDLVGFECEGASGPLYAEMEDHFPKCRDIHPMDWSWAYSPEDVIPDAP